MVSMPEKAISPPLPRASKRRALVTIVAVVVLVTAYFVVMAIIRAHVTGVIKSREQKPLPAFTLKDTTDRTWTRESVLGKTVMLNFFRSQCASCWKERKVIRQLVAEVDKDKVLVLGIMVDPAMGYPEAMTRDTLARFDYRHPVLLADSAFVDAFHAGWAKITPVTYIANPKGVIVKALRGHQSLDTLRAAIR